MRCPGKQSDGSSDYGGRKPSSKTRCPKRVACQSGKDEHPTAPLGSRHTARLRADMRSRRWYEPFVARTMFRRRSRGAPVAAGAALCLCWAQTGVGRADDASFFGDGVTVYALKESRIRMQKETVVIRYDAKDRARTWIADCTFVFVNESDQPIDLQMGFPDWRTFGDASAADAWAIKRFVVDIGGRDVETEHKDVARLAVQGIDALPPGSESDYQGAYTWQVHFAPRAKLVVHNTYSFGGLSTMGPFLSTYDQPGFPGEWLFWRARGSNEKIGGCDFDDAIFQRIQYIVTTARTWGGPIGEADITIQIPPLALPHQLVPSPTATSIGRGVVHWHRTEWSPTQEIALYFATPTGEQCRRPPLFDSEVQARAWMRVAKENGVTRDAVGLVRDAYRARRAGEKRGALPAGEAKIVALLNRFALSLPAAMPFGASPRK